MIYYGKQILQTVNEETPSKFELHSEQFAMLSQYKQTPDFSL